MNRVIKELFDKNSIKDMNDLKSKIDIKIKNNLNIIKEYLLDILFPRRCPVCDNIVVPSGELICSECEKVFTEVPEPRCMKCSKPILSDVVEYCRDCSKKSKKYEKGFAMWVYDDKLKKSIARFKYNGKSEYSKYYSKKIYEFYKSELDIIKPDFLIPVPIHKSKLNIRGYNQAGVLANDIGKLADIQVLEDYLIRTKKTLPQKELNDIERRKNLSDAFGINVDKYNMDKLFMLINKNKKDILKVVLIDDIYTTGATVDICTQKLLEAGIKEVYFISIGISYGS